jgi:drug/metabolite transporter superfamily protein YnfA
MNKLFTALLGGLIVLLLLTFVEVSQLEAVYMAFGTISFVFSLVILRVVARFK